MPIDFIGCLHNSVHRMIKVGSGQKMYFLCQKFFLCTSIFSAQFVAWFFTIVFANIKLSYPFLLLSDFALFSCENTRKPLTLKPAQGQEKVALHPYLEVLSISKENKRIK